MSELGEPWAELLDAVIRVASAPGAKPGANVFAARVPWSRITRLRAALDDAGIEWRDRG